jgi:hypothetical protein
MTIVGDVHYYVIKAPPSAPKAPKSPLEQFKDLVYMDSPTTARSKQILQHLQPPKRHFFDRIFEQPKVEFLLKPQLYEDSYELKSTSQVTLERRNSFDDAFKDPHPSTITTTALKHNRYRNVRSIAFANEKTELMTVDEWIKSKNKASDTKSLVDPDSPRKRHTRKQAESVSIDPVQFYEAHYYASDDDYLMHSVIRKYFKQNTATSDDAILFTIQSSSSEGGEDHPTLAHLALLLGENDERQQRMRRRLKYVVLLYGIFSFVMLRYVGNLSLPSALELCICDRILFAILPLPHLHYFTLIHDNQSLFI